MVNTIIPMVHGDGYHKKGIGSEAKAHLATAALGGALVGLVLWGVSRLVGISGRLPASRALWFGAALIALLYALREAGICTLPFPICRRQVPRSWSKRFSPNMASMLYGFCLGVGLFTRVTVATFYVAILVVLTLRTPVEAAIAMSVFGIGRALPLLFLERHKPDRRLAIVLSWWTPFVRMANGMILAHCGIALLTSALGFG